MGCGSSVKKRVTQQPPVASPVKRTVPPVADDLAASTPTSVVGAAAVSQAKLVGDALSTSIYENHAQVSGYAMVKDPPVDPEGRTPTFTEVLDASCESIMSRMLSGELPTQDLGSGQTPTFSGGETDFETTVLRVAAETHLSGRSSTPEQDPVSLQGAAEKARFLREDWGPFAADLDALVEGARRRRASGYSDHEVMPSQAMLLDLLRRSLDLTERWHGRANVSALYEAFCEAAELDGHSAYVLRDLRQERSADGYTRVLDAQARRKAYGSGAGKKAPSGAAEVPLVGRLPQATGESPIDNLVLPSLMRRRSALLLFVGHRIQQFLVRVLRRKQQRILAQLGLADEGALSANAAAAARPLDDDVEELRRRVREAVAFEDESLAWRALGETGRPLASYGQLPEDARARIDGFLAAELAGGSSASGAEEGDDVLEEDLEAFLAHCASRPGRAFRGSGVQQKLMLFKAMRSPALRVRFRSDVEPFTQHKYLGVPWTRSLPLMALQPQGEGEVGEPQLVSLRPSGACEVTRFRKNVFPYGESHGLGLSGGGCAEGLQWAPGTLMYEFGTLLCADESAKVPNHGVTDVEKIVRDCLVLCPEGGLSETLPGEALHDVGLNPVIASSIGRTQHTQVMRATASDFPLMAERCNPQWYKSLGAWVDIVQVGEAEDACFLSARSRAPGSVSLLRFLTDLRLRFLESFGRNVDFNVSCHPTEKGEFIVNFFPQACLKKIKVPHGEGCMGLDFDYENPDLGERVTQHRLPVALVDCSHGKGNVLSHTEKFWQIALEGRPMLTRLYDFNRKPGARVVLEDFLRLRPPAGDT